MSRWQDWGDYKSVKKPPPAHGIKMKKAGSTWWGQRWIEALQNVLRGDAGRLARGRTYARAGRTHDLTIHGGKVTAGVTGSRSAPYRITITLKQLPDAAWTKAIAGMAEKAQFAAELLANQMPQEIDEVFRAAGCSLFPKQRAELLTSCSCPDWGDPCKHVAATHYVLGEALDGDPFLLFELRGRSKARVLDALRSARDTTHGDTQTAAKKTRPTKAAARAHDTERLDVPSVSLGKLEAADYDRPREALPALHFSFAAPTSHGAVLQQLGVPSAWSGKDSPLALLSPLVRRAAEAARRLALTEPRLEESEGETAPAGNPRASEKPITPVKRRAKAKPRATPKPRAGIKKRQ